MVATWGGYRMARGWHYAKLSLSNARRLPFSDMCILLFLFLSLCRFCLFVFFFCSHWSLVDVPLISFCPVDHVPDWQPRIVLGMVEARSVNVKKATTTTTMHIASCVTDDLSISPRFSPTIFNRDANSILLSTPLYRSRLYAQNPVFEIAHHQESVKA